MPITEKMLEIKAKFLEALEECMEECLVSLPPEVKLIQVIGYTPTWNDGDVCAHGSYAMLGRQAIEDEGEKWRISEEIWSSSKTDYKLDEDKDREVSEVLCEVFDQKYGTDYVITMVRDGSWTAHYGRYEE